MELSTEVKIELPLVACKACGRLYRQSARCAAESKVPICGKCSFLRTFYESLDREKEMGVEAKGS